MEFAGLVGGGRGPTRIAVGQRELRKERPRDRAGFARCSRLARRCATALLVPFAFAAFVPNVSADPERHYTYNTLRIKSITQVDYKRRPTVRIQLYPLDSTAAPVERYIVRWHGPRHGTVDGASNQGHGTGGGWTYKEERQIEASDARCPGVSGPCLEVRLSTREEERRLGNGIKKAYQYSFLVTAKTVVGRSKFVDPHLNTRCEWKKAQNNGNLECHKTSPTPWSLPWTGQGLNIRRDANKPPMFQPESGGFGKQSYTVVLPEDIGDGKPDSESERVVTTLTAKDANGDRIRFRILGNKRGFSIGDEDGNGYSTGNGDGTVTVKLNRTMDYESWSQRNGAALSFVIEASDYTTDWDYDTGVVTCDYGHTGTNGEQSGDQVFTHSGVQHTHNGTGGHGNGPGQHDHSQPGFSRDIHGIHYTNGHPYKGGQIPGRGPELGRTTYFIPCNYGEAKGPVGSDRFHGGKSVTRVRLKLTDRPEPPEDPPFEGLSGTLDGSALTVEWQPPLNRYRPPVTRFLVSWRENKVVQPVNGQDGIGCTPEPVEGWSWSEPIEVKARRSIQFISGTTTPHPTANTYSTVIDFGDAVVGCIVPRVQAVNKDGESAGTTTQVYNPAATVLWPVADAGQDQTGQSGDTITLVPGGTNSQGGTGGLTYTWRQVSGPTVTVQNSQVLLPFVRQQSTIVLELTVTDDQTGLTGTDEMSITFLPGVWAEPNFRISRVVVDYGDRRQNVEILWDPHVPPAGKSVSKYTIEVTNPFRSVGNNAGDRVDWVMQWVHGFPYSLRVQASYQGGGHSPWTNWFHTCRPPTQVDPSQNPGAASKGFYSIDRKAVPICIMPWGNPNLRVLDRPDAGVPDWNNRFIAWDRFIYGYVPTTPYEVERYDVDIRNGVNSRWTQTVADADSVHIDGVWTSRVNMYEHTNNVPNPPEYTVRVRTVLKGGAKTDWSNWYHACRPPARGGGSTGTNADQPPSHPGCTENKPPDPNRPIASLGWGDPNFSVNAETDPPQIEWDDYPNAVGYTAQLTAPAGWTGRRDEGFAPMSDAGPEYTMRVKAHFSDGFETEWTDWFNTCRPPYENQAPAGAAPVCTQPPQPPTGESQVAEAPPAPCIVERGALAIGTGFVQRDESWDLPDCRAHHRVDRPARYFRFTLSERATVRIDLTSDADAALYVSKGEPQNEWGTPPKATMEHRVNVRRANGKLVHEEYLTAFKVLAPGEYTAEAVLDADGVGSGGVPSFGLSVAATAPLAAVSVADARVEEGPGAVLSFAVTLDDAASETARVSWATSDGTAVAGQDYTAGSGTLTFAPGETEKSITVAVLDDAHDEGEETLTLTLSNADGVLLGDAEATGTIANEDPLLTAWLARFGRTVASQTVDAVTERLAAPADAGSHVTLGGQRIGLSSTIGTDGPEAGGIDYSVIPGVPVAVESRIMAGRDLLIGSSFHLSAGSALRWTAWGRASLERFENRDGGLPVDGEVVTGVFGADWERGKWLTGIALTHSLGEGGMRPRGMAMTYDIENTVTAVNPYVRVKLSERLSAWALVATGRASSRSPGSARHRTARRAAA